MYERKYTRIDAVRIYLDDMLNHCEDINRRRNGFVHLYGVGQACALIALHRGHDRKYAELAEIAGMLHDYAKYKDGVEAEHTHKSAAEAKKILSDINQFTDDEIEMVCSAISKHSDKKRVDAVFDEILKDGDELQHWLRNPVEEYVFCKERTQKLARELGLMK